MPQKTLILLPLAIALAGAAYLGLEPRGGEPILQGEGMPRKIHHEVGFTAQAPLGDWEDERQEYGCEETAVFMAMSWVKNQEFTLKEAEEEIERIAEFELKEYGVHHDTSAKDTMERILQAYYKHESIWLRYNIKIDDIRSELARGNLVIVPVRGLKNPYYTPPGPPAHMMLFVGYDDDKSEFIVHDPGTQRGENYRYSYREISATLMDYPTGNQEPLTDLPSAMVVVSK